jgi:hypothetical protein
VSRRVFFCTATWKDPHFQRNFSKLAPFAQEDFLTELEKLRGLLEEAPHPATDPRIRQAFKAKSYGGVVGLRGASLIEYSLGNLIRVIAKYPAREGCSDILLVAVTLCHDHDRLKRIIKNNRTAIDGWNEELDNPQA